MHDKSCIKFLDLLLLHTKPRPTVRQPIEEYSYQHNENEQRRPSSALTGAMTKVHQE